VSKIEDRINFYQQRIWQLSYQWRQKRLELDELDKQITAYEAALEAADQVRRDYNTEAAIDAAKENTNA